VLAPAHSSCRRPDQDCGRAGTWWSGWCGGTAGRVGSCRASGRGGRGRAAVPGAGTPSRRRMCLSPGRLPVPGRAAGAVRCRPRHAQPAGPGVGDGPSS
jgi:hypothetical protein